MKSKILALVMCALLAFSFAGCKKDEAKTDAAAAPAADAAAPAAAAPAADAAAPAAAPAAVVNGKAELDVALKAFTDFDNIAKTDANDCDKFGANIKASLFNQKEALTAAFAKLSSIDENSADAKALEADMKKLEAFLDDNANLTKTLEACAANADVQAFATELDKVVGE